jgi:prepilin-type processing-associated H-X9-DG protein
LLPAVQAAREAARRTNCVNNLKNLALAAQNHHDTAKHFPTGGWGWFWVGDPDRGFGKEQPGGWAFNLMPYTEENSAYKAGSDGNGEMDTPRQLEAIRDLIKTPLTLLRCPSRRSGAPLPKTANGPRGAASYAYNAADDTAARGSQAFPLAGRSDYAVNCGDQNVSGNPWNEINQNPASLTAAKTLNWCVVGTTGRTRTPVNECGPSINGISFQRSEVGAQHVSDGTSKTYLIGEKYLNPVDYETGSDPGDNETWCTGYNNDTFRNAYNPPVQDTAGFASTFRFGSIHSGGFNMSFCDAHVEVIAYDIDVDVHRMNGNRRNSN